MGRKSEPDIVRVKELDADIEKILSAALGVKAQIARCKAINKRKGLEIEVELNSSFEEANLRVSGAIAEINKSLLAREQVNVDKEVEEFISRVLEYKAKAHVLKKTAAKKGAVVMTGHNSLQRARTRIEGFLSKLSKSIDNQIEAAK